MVSDKTRRSVFMRKIWDWCTVVPAVSGEEALNTMTSTAQVHGAGKSLRRLR